LRWLLLCVVSVVLAGCGQASTRPTAITQPARAAEQSGNTLAAEIAASMIGRAYRAGGDSPGAGFDCSGLVHYCYRLLGLELPRTAEGQRLAATTVPPGELAVGDLLFFRIGGGSHVGIYYGNDEFVHAPSTGKAVMRSQLSDAYWRTRLLEARRPGGSSQGEDQVASGSRPRTSSGIATTVGSAAADTGALSRNP
jgi:cell wall-associated NlpC family hydrolase